MGPQRSSLSGLQNLFFFSKCKPAKKFRNQNLAKFDSNYLKKLLEDVQWFSLKRFSSEIISIQQVSFRSLPGNRSAKKRLGFF